MSLLSASGLELALCFRSFMSVALAAVNTAGTEVASVQNERDRNIELKYPKPECRSPKQIRSFMMSLLFDIRICFEFPSPSCLSHNKIRLRIQRSTHAQTRIQERCTGARANFEIILNGKRGISVTTRNLAAKGVLHEDHRSRLPDFALIDPAKVKINCGGFGIGAVLEFDEERLAAMKGGDGNVSVSGKMRRRG